MAPSVKTLLWMYEHMVMSRYYEDVIAAVYMEGKQPLFNMANGPIPGEMHLSSGQEPCAVGVCAHLQKEDVVIATHRPHHVALAKGVNLRAMTAEIFGKKVGLSGGRGGHMHLFDTAVNFSCSGIVGEGLAPAAGAALARKMRGEEGIAVAFIGEGAANQGAFHETLNLAAVWKLPFICIIEDNAYGISVPKSLATSVPHNDVRAASYGIPGHHIKGNDPYAIYEIAGEAIARARAGDGPSLIEIETDRLAGHFMGDTEAYRPDGEKETLFERDPIPKMRDRLIGDGVATAEEIEGLTASAHEKVDEAVAYARQADYGAPEEALEKVFV